MPAAARLIGLPAVQPASSAEAFAAWRRGEGSLLLCVYSYLMTSVSAAVEVSPGEEFRVALQEARQVGMVRQPRWPGAAQSHAPAAAVPGRSQEPSWALHSLCSV